MPGRTIPLVNNEHYHILNRGIDLRPTFTDKREFERAFEALGFYQFANPRIRLSTYLRFDKNSKTETLKKLAQKGVLIEIVSYCFMTNHFHFLLKQKVDGGISRFMSNFQNSYTRYFNAKHRRIGPLFLDQFKAIRVESNEQLLHLSRYIHLNPYSGYLVKNIERLNNYSWSSLPEFFGYKQGFCHKDVILNFFKKLTTYQKFIYDQADYQRELDKIKHLTLEA